MEYWHSIRPGPDLLPGRQHFDPLDIAGLTPNIFMPDRFPESGRLRYRLAGRGREPVATSHPAEF